MFNGSLFAIILHNNIMIGNDLQCRARGVCVMGVCVCVCVCVCGLEQEFMEKSLTP